MIGSARENQLGQVFTGLSLSTCCVVALGEVLSRDEVAHTLSQRLDGRPVEISDWDKTDRFYMLGQVTDGDAGVAITRFRFQRRVQQMSVETGARRVGEDRILLRNLVATCSLTLYDSQWASLAVTVPIATEIRDSRDYHAALAFDGSGRPIDGLTPDQVVGLARTFSGCECGKSPACEILGGPAFCSSVGMRCGTESARHPGQMTLVWSLDPQALEDPKSDMNSAEAARSLPFAIAGIVAGDDRWADKSRDQAAEGVGQHVGPTSMVADVCGTHLFLLTLGESERRRKDIYDFGTYEPQLRALEYALYQNAIVASADAAVSELERETERLIGVDSDRGDRDSEDTLLKLLRRVWSTHAGVLLACEARYKPWIFKYPLEQQIVDAVLAQSGTNHQLESIRTRLRALNTLADEAHSIAAGHQLSEQQARLVEIQNTNLVSQLELRDLTSQLANLTAASQRSSEKLGWINALIVITASINLLAVIAAVNASSQFGQNLAAVWRDAVPIAVTLAAGVAFLTVASIGLTYLMGKAAALGRGGDREAENPPYLSKLKVHESLRKSKVVSALVDQFESGYRTMAPDSTLSLRVQADADHDLDSLFGRWDDTIHELETACDQVYNALKERD